MGAVVVGVDTSESSARALRLAHEEARLRGARLRVVHAWHMPQPVYPGGPVTLPLDRRTFERDAQAVLDAAVASLGQTDVPIDARLVEDAAGQALVEAAGYADLLVVGSRGHGGLAGLVLGSVGRHCVRHARCPVLIVPRAGTRAATAAA